MKKLTKTEYLSLFDVSVHDKIEASARKPGVVALVLFENQQMDSSRFGDRSSLIVGEPYTYKTTAECEGKWLNDLPSQRQYATAYTVVAEWK